MNNGYVGLIAVTFSIMLIVSQRIEPRHQRKMRYVILLLAVGLWLLREHLRVEHGLGVFIALIVSFLFWLLLGRYNPVRSSDETIKVYGMND